MATANKKRARRLEQEADRVEAEMEKVGTGLGQMIQEQKNFLEKGNRRLHTIRARLEGLETRLSKYITGSKEPDEEFEKLKTEYMEYVVELEEIQITLGMAEESIAEGEALMPGGVSTEQPVLGPNFGRPRDEQ